MTPEAFIEEAIAAGQRDGIASLDADQRLVYLITEAECLCDMEGIDSFLHSYAPTWISEAAYAFEVVGAAVIGAELRAVPLNSPVGDPRLDRLNKLITGRVGYNYETICKIVAERLTRRFT